MMYKSNEIKIIVVLVGMLLFTGTVVQGNQLSVGHIEDHLISVKFISTSSFINTFRISESGIANITIKLETEDSDRTTVYYSIQKNSNGIWFPIQSWSSEAKQNYHYIYRTYSLQKGFSYRLKSTAYVYQNEKLVESINNITESIRY